MRFVIYLAIWVDGLDRRGNTRSHATPGYGHQDKVQVGHLLHQLEPDGALASHHVVVVVRVDDGAARLCRDPVRGLPPPRGRGLARHWRPAHVALRDFLRRMFSRNPSKSQ